MYKKGGARAKLTFSLPSASLDLKVLISSCRGRPVSLSVSSFHGVAVQFGEMVNLLDSREVLQL